MGNIEINLDVYLPSINIYYNYYQILRNCNFIDDESFKKRKELLFKLDNNFHNKR